MRDYRISVDIAAPPERVWAVMSDAERWPEWTPSVTSIKRLDTGPLRIGSRIRIKQPKFMAAVWTVTALEDGRAFTWVTSAPGTTITARHSLEPIGDGTRATLSVQYAGLLERFLDWLTRDVSDRYLAMEAAGLKQRSELRT